MAKNVFKPQEIMYLSRRVFIEPPRIEAPEVVEEVEAPKEEAPEPVVGPSVDELRREADEFRKGFEAEKTKMLEAAAAQAASIKAEAEQAVLEEVKRNSSQAQKARQDAEEEAKRIVAEAQKKADGLEAEIQARRSQAEREATEKGLAEGRERGYREGAAEVGRLVERLQSILAKAIEKRAEIIKESEAQIINLVLLIAKKVIKVISENQRNVVINNVVQALGKLKSRGDIVIRVNLADLQLTSDHVKDFTKMVENVKSISVLEDNSIEPGGCVIETDFGQIDARISSQLHEIEERILDLMPIRSSGER